MSVEPIFDPDLARRRLARATKEGAASFLLDRAAEDLAERLDAVQRSFGRICDVGTPGPVVAHALSRRFSAAQVVRLAPMAGTGGSVVGEADRLPLAAESCDLIVSALALHSTNDLPGALVQIRRALKPDGLFLACLAGGRTLHELRTALTEAEARLMGGVSPRVYPFADVRDMGGLLQRAGFALPVADSEQLVVRYADMFALMADLRAMGATSVLVARNRRPPRRSLFLEAARIYADRFSDPDGRIRATFEIVSVSGWAPHASQQQPARRGSGKISLAEALGDRSTELSGEA